MRSMEKTALHFLAKRIQALDDEIRALDRKICSYMKKMLPNTMSLPGIAHHGAAVLYCAVGSDISRIKNEATFSRMCGISPIPVSSGNNHHHRLDRAGNRKANCVFYTMAITRMQHCEKTQDFIARKMSEGKGKKDAIRILKRYLVREALGALKDTAGSPPPSTRTMMIFRQVNAPCVGSCERRASGANSHAGDTTPSKG